jgi:hypothetical protein
MLIDQMKQHPEEFRGFAGKFAGTLELAQEVQRGATRNMSKRDAAAIVEAAQTYLFEVWLAEDVLTKMMQPEQKLEKYAQGTTGRSPGKSVLGTMTGANIANNTWGPSYEEHLQERYKMEIEKQWRQVNDRTLRNTKPFKSFI